MSIDQSQNTVEKKILLLGGAGYIGLVIAKKLAKRGMSIVIMDNLIYEHQLGLHSIFYESNITFINHDIRKGINKDLIKENGITDVIVLAGLVGDPITKKYPEISKEINNHALQNVFDDLVGCHLNRLVFISTCSNYGLIQDGEKANEEFKLSPLSLYAEDKVNNENYLKENANRYDYSYTILRFATAFGVSPRMRFDLSVNEFVYEAYTKNSLEIYDPDTWRPYCHVIDFANLIEKVLKSSIDNTDGEIFNAGGDENNFTKRNLVDLIKKHIPKLNVNYVTGGNDPRNYIVDFSKVRNKLEFVPSVSVEDGIKEIIEYLNKGVFLDYESNKNFYGNYLIEE